MWLSFFSCLNFWRLSIVFFMQTGKKLPRNCTDKYSKIFRKEFVGLTSTKRFFHIQRCYLKIIKKYIFCLCMSIQMHKAFVIYFISCLITNSNFPGLSLPTHTAPPMNFSYSLTKVVISCYGPRVIRNNRFF